MKRVFYLLLFALQAFRSPAQSFQIEQLALDIQKLAALRNILNDLYKGYQILNTGYETIRSISEGNFNLHKAFLDGLLAVSPAVRNDVRVADIIANQASLVQEYRKAFGRFGADRHFTPEELGYLQRVYGNLLKAGLGNISDLTNILTEGLLRMSDAERLSGIEDIYQRSASQLLFLRQFNSGTAVLAAQRAAEANDLQTLGNLFGRP